jgi:hypothetical protein
VKILQIMEGTPIPQRDGTMYRTVDLAWDLGDLRKVYSQASTVLPAIVSNLAGLSAIRDIAIGNSDYVATYELEPFGKQLLTRLRAAGLVEAPQS